MEGSDTRQRRNQTNESSYEGDIKRKVADILLKKLDEPPREQFKHKIYLTLGVVMTVVSLMVFLQLPEYFWAWYTGWFIPLFIHRTIDYFDKKFQFLMLDFCYFIHMMCLLQIFVFPESQILFKALFVVANGPLAFGIVTWQNSIVFHSLDKMTSILVHVYPPLLTWIWRWKGGFRPEIVGANPSLGYLRHLSWAETLQYPLLAYLIWNGLYLLITEYFSREIIDRDKEIRITTRRFAISPQSTVYATVCTLLRVTGYLKRGQEPAGDSLSWKVAFYIAQLGYMCMTMVWTKLMYDYCVIHSFALFSVLTYAMWNGASYYVRVFARGYRHKIEGAVSDVWELLEHSKK